MITLNDKMVAQLRECISDCFDTYGLPDHPRFADRLAVTLETILNIAGADPCESKMEMKPIEVEYPIVETAEDKNWTLIEKTEQAKEVPSEDTKPAEKKETRYMKVVKLKESGMSVNDIAKAMDISVSTVYNHLKYARDMGAK